MGLVGYLESGPNSTASAKTPLLPIWYRLRLTVEKVAIREPFASRKWHTASSEAGTRPCARHLREAASSRCWGSARHCSQHCLLAIALKATHSSPHRRTSSTWSGHLVRFTTSLCASATLCFSIPSRNQPANASYPTGTLSSS